MNRYVITCEQRGYWLYKIHSNWPDSQLTPDPFKVGKVGLFKEMEEAIASFKIQNIRYFGCVVLDEWLLFDDFSS